MDKSQRANRNLEENIQMSILEWVEANRPDVMCVHIPNGAIRSHRERRRMRDQGMTPGMPDLLLIDAQGQHGYMEVKTDRGSISMVQWDIREELVGRGVPWALVRSKEEVAQTLEKWGWEPPAPEETIENSETSSPAANQQWPAEIEALPKTLQTALIGFSWDEPQDVETRYGLVQARHLTPTPVGFQALWKKHKKELKSAGIRVQRVKGLGWQAVWWFNSAEMG